MPDTRESSDTALSAGAVATEPPVSLQAEGREDELVLDDLLVEDVSIDGMCGVY